MKKYPIAIQIHSLREDYAENPLKTFKMIKEMGYDGVELNIGAAFDKAEEQKKYLDEAGLVCYSAMCGIADISAENIEKTTDNLITLGAKSLVVGSVNFEKLKADPKGYADECVAAMIAANDYVKARGLRAGYHAHDGDYLNKVGDVPFYEYVFMNTPEDFGMTIDTGNMMAGGGDPIECIKKFPGRAPVVHVKGYGKELGYTTPVWKSELDWVEFFKTARDIGKAETFYIEFGARGEYTPVVRATLSCKWLEGWVEKL